MTTLPKWNDERTATLEAGVSLNETVTKATVEQLAVDLETSPRSISSKLRKLGYEVEKASDAAKSFTDEQAEELTEFLNANDGAFTYAEIAEQFDGGKFTARQVQGKILSMEMTGSVKQTPKVEATRTYSDAEADQIVSMINAGKFVEEISETLGRPIASIRGKALSLLREERITKVPAQRDVKGPAADSFEALGDIGALTVAEIAQKLEKTDRGVKTMLTRRGIDASDYKGSVKAAKNAA